MELQTRVGCVQGLRWLSLLILINSLVPLILLQVVSWLLLPWLATVQICPSELKEGHESWSSAYKKQGTDRPPCSGALPGLAQFPHLFSWYSFVLKRIDAGWEMGTIVLDRDVNHKLSRCIHSYSAVNLNFLSYVRLQTAWGFKNSPTLFNEILAKDVRRLHMNQGEIDDFPARMEKKHWKWQKCFWRTY